MCLEGSESLRRAETYKDRVVLCAGVTFQGSAPRRALEVTEGRGAVKKNLA